MGRRRKQPTTTSVPRDLAIERLRSWQSVRPEALAQLAEMLKRARASTGRKQRQVQAIAQQPGQEYMSETTVSRLEKPHVLRKAGDVGLMNVAYLALLYRLDVSSVVRRMFAPFERHALALDEVQALAQGLSDERMARVVEYTRELAREQLVDDEELEPGEWVETAHVWADDARHYLGFAPSPETTTDGSRAGGER